MHSNETGAASSRPEVRHDSHGNNMRRFILVGERSRLGRALLESLIGAGEQCSLVNLSQLANLHFFERKRLWQKVTPESTILWIGAVTDFRQPDSTLTRINFQLPQEALEVLSMEQKSIQFITFGSVYEGLGRSNNYLDSKGQLAAWLSKNKPSGSLHIKTHTLVGAREPQPHMLLGQLLRSFRENNDFTLGSPSVTRQYIDQSSFVEWLMKELSGKSGSQGVLQVGGAEPVRIDRLVTHLMKMYRPKLKILQDNRASWESTDTLPAGIDNVHLGCPSSIDSVEKYFGKWLAEN